MLPLRETVVFPYMVIPLFVGRAKSLKAIEMAMEGSREILVVSQKEAATDTPASEDVFRVGTVCRIMQMLKLPDGIIKILVEGLYRVDIQDYIQADEVFEVSVSKLAEDPEPSDEAEALRVKVLDLFSQYLKLNQRIPVEIYDVAGSVNSPGRMADIIAAHLTLKVEVKQSILEAHKADARLEILAELLSNEIKILSIEKDIRNKVKADLEEIQKDTYLRDQMRNIQKELGDSETTQLEVEEYNQKIADSGMPDYAKERCQKELDKLSKMAASSAEAGVLRNWLDIMVDLPWVKESVDHLDIHQASAILDADHFGLKEPKERILEYLAVCKLKGAIKGPILCLLGPPGVGKTSLAKSVAKAIGREYGRIALGGMRDEAEIRGHRRTYVGAMPGRIIQMIRRLGTRNPLILLDEIDKTGADFKGDPASALLEVLDPEQNSTFTDHCLGVPFDLSKVLFFTTANVPHTIPPPLRDRMEIISLPGYTEEEKIEIAKRHLVPKQRDENGLDAKDIEFPDESIVQVTRFYTREAGVRGLERKLGAIARKVARAKVTSTAKRRRKHKITLTTVRKYLGIPRFSPGLQWEKDTVGLVNGLAWTSVGGTTLPIEAVVMPGQGKTILTGKLGKVMQESARAAISWVRRHREELGLAEDFYKTLDVHIHAPEAAIPKDGPSAGVTISTAVISALTGVPVRRDIAMTGEISLKGDVMPVGGIKEKFLAAFRMGIKEIILCKENERHLEELPEEVREQMTFHLVEHLDEVVDLALTEKVRGRTPPTKKSKKKKKPKTAKGKKKSPAKASLTRSARKRTARG
jgi:ATP-dependent Lon protease